MKRHKQKRFYYHGYSNISDITLEIVTLNRVDYMVVNRLHICINDGSFRAVKRTIKNRILRELKGYGKDEKKGFNYSGRCATCSG